MSALNWDFGIIDRMSGPATTIANNLNKIDDSLSKLDIATSVSESALDSLASKTLGGSSANIATDVDSIVGALDKTVDSVSKTEKAFDSLSQANTADAATGISDSVDAATASMNKLNQAESKAEKAVSKLAASTQNDPLHSASMQSNATTIAQSLSGVAGAADKANAAVGKVDKGTSQALGTGASKAAKSVSGPASTVGSGPGELKLSNASRMLQLIGKVSPTAQSAMMSVGRSIDKADGFLGQFGTSVGGIASKALPMLGAGAAAASAGVVAGAAAIVASIVAVDVAIFSAASEFTKFAVQVGTAREKSDIVFQNTTKSVETTGWMMADATQKAYKYGQSVDHIRDTYAKLQNSGLEWYKQQRAMDAMMAAQAGTGNAGAGDAIMQTINQLQYDKTMKMKNFKALGAAGITEDDVFTAMAQKTGMGVEELKKANEKGEITSEKSIEAIFAALETKHAGVLNKYQNSLEVGMGRIKNLPTTLMNQAFDASNAGSGVQGFYDKIGGLVHQGMSLVFKDDGSMTDQGNRIIGIINGIADCFTPLFDTLGKIPTETIENALGTLLSLGEGLVSMLKPLVEGAFEAVLQAILPLFGAFAQTDATGMDQFKNTIKELAPVFKVFGFVLAEVLTLGILPVISGISWLIFACVKVSDKVKATGDAIEWAFEHPKEVLMGFASAVGATIGETVSKVQNKVLGITDWLASVWDNPQAALSKYGGAVKTAISDAFSSAWESVTGYPDRFAQAGRDMIAGLIGGVTSSGSGVGQALRDVANSAISSFKSAMGIHSPSRVFAGLGSYTAEGFASGVEDSAPDVQDAVASMIATPNVASLQSTMAVSSPTASGGTGGGNVINVHIENINVSGGGSRDSIKQGTMEAWEEIALQLGMRLQAA